MLIFITYTATKKVKLHASHEFTCSNSELIGAVSGIYVLNIVPNYQLGRDNQFSYSVGMR